MDNFITVIMFSGKYQWFLLLNIINVSYSANILGIFPTPSYSHQQPMLILSRALASRGHNLTVFTTNPSKNPLANHKEIDLNYMYKVFRDFEKVKGNQNCQTRTDGFAWIEKVPKFYHLFSDTFFSSGEFKNFMRLNKDTKFDLIIYESLYPSLLGLSTYFGNPHVIGILTFGTHTFPEYLVGNPNNPTYMPHYAINYNHRMTFYERFHNFLLNVYSMYKLNYYIQSQDKVMRKYLGENLPSTYKLLENVSLTIFSSDLSTEYPKPVQPNSVHIGAVHLQSSNPLPQDIKQWFDEAEEGVIYFSLGSNMQGTSVPEEKRKIFMNVFKDFQKVRVLWKWEADEGLPGKPENVMFKKWIPQQDVLAHPKVKLFISQVGLQSSQEAIYNSVPVLALPIFADQGFNAEKIQHSGGGIVMEYNDITFDKFKSTVYELLNNESYRINMKKLTAISKDKPLQAIEQAVWWVEYVLRHNGAPHLRPANMKLKWYELYLLDIIFLIISILFIFITIVICIMKVIYKNVIKHKIKIE